VRPQALAAIQGASLVIHAGDIGGPEIVRALEAVAPVLAVRGNNDVDDWGRQLPATRVVEIGPYRLYVLHDLKTLDREPRVEGWHAVISGHSHRPLVREEHDVLYLNPGSAGPRRFRLPVSVARLYLHNPALRAELVTLHV
jgi:putative phosphoesterase